MNHTSHRSPFIDDLVPLILECHSHWWPRDLCRLAQVSSAWAWHVRKRLYAQLIVHSYRSANLLANSLSYNPQLQRLVQGLHLFPMASHSGNIHPYASRDLTGVRLLLGLDGLRSITLGGDLSEGAERFIQLMANPRTVEKLHINGSLLSNSFDSMPSLEWSEMMAMLFPNLKELRLTRVELDIIPPSIPYQLSLTDLMLDQVVIVSGFLPHLLHDAKRLHRLSVSSDSTLDMDEQIRLLLNACFIDTLSYEALAGGPAPTRYILPSDAASTVSDLRHIRLRVDVINWDAVESICERCRGLQELEVSSPWPITMPSFPWEGLIGRVPSSLRRLGVPGKVEGLEGLRTVCERRNIELFAC